MCRSALTKIALLGVTLVTFACASTGSASAGRRDASLLTRVELQASSSPEVLLLDAIRALRPHFLASRAGERLGGGTDEVQVAINNGIPGSLSLIADLRVSMVSSVELLSPTVVVQRYGMRDNLGPVLLIMLR
jgi:hypothetical protein